MRGGIYWECWGEKLGRASRWFRGDFFFTKYPIKRNTLSNKHTCTRTILIDERGMETERYMAVHMGVLRVRVLEKEQKKKWRERDRNRNILQLICMAHILQFPPPVLLKVVATLGFVRFLSLLFRSFLNLYSLPVSAFALSISFLRSTGVYCIVIR